MKRPFKAPRRLRPREEARPAHRVIPGRHRDVGPEHVRFELVLLREGAPPGCIAELDHVLKVLLGLGLVIRGCRPAGTAPPP